MYALLQRLTHSAMALTSARLLLVILALWVPAVNASVLVSADPASPSAQDRPSPDYDQPANHPAKDDDSADWLSQDEKEEWVDGLMQFSFGLQEGGERDPRPETLPPVYGHPLSQSSSRVNGGDILDYGRKEDESRQEKKPHRETSDSVQDMFAKRPLSRQRRSAGNPEQHGHRHRQAAAEENPLPEMEQRFLSPNDQDIQEAENGGRYIDGRRNRPHYHHDGASSATYAYYPWMHDRLNDNSDIPVGERGGSNRLHNHHDRAPLATAPSALATAPALLATAPAVLATAPAVRATAPALLATAPAALQDHSDIPEGKIRGRNRLHNHHHGASSATYATPPPYYPWMHDRLNDNSDIPEGKSGGLNRLHNHHDRAPLATAPDVPATAPALLATAPAVLDTEPAALQNNFDIPEGGSGSWSRLHNPHDGPLLATAPTALEELGYSRRVHLEDRVERLWTPVTNNISCWPEYIDHLLSRSPVNRNCSCTTTNTTVNVTCNMVNYRAFSKSRIRNEVFRWTNETGDFPRNVVLSYYGCNSTLTNCQPKTFCWADSLSLVKGLHKQINNRPACNSGCDRIGGYSTPRSSSCPTG